MNTQLRTLLALATLGLASPAHAGVDWVLEEGDAYSRVICRAADDSTARKPEIYVQADEKGRGPALSCKLENFEIVLENDVLTEKKIKRKNLIWGPLEDGMKRRRYFVLPEVCFEENGTWRCRKQVHEKNDVFQIDLPGTCPYKVKVGALPIITTETTNKTKAPLQPPGTMMRNGEVTSNPFAWHPDHEVDGAYYRDLAIVWVSCPPEPLVVPTCGNGVLDEGEICDDGNRRDDDYCSNRCTPPSANPICGDGNIDPGEQCDDGNQNDDDGCSNDCELPPLVPPSCGDGIVQTGNGESCEIGMVLAPIGGGNPDRVCRDNCSYCGDGILDQGEECDDGNGNGADDCSNDCTLPPPPAYRYCEMFRDPSFSRDFEGNVRLKANGRMEAIDTSVADPGDDLVVDIGTERIIVKASTVEEGVVFEREFLPGSLSYFERSGNRGWEHDASNTDFMKLKMNRDYTRFNLQLPGAAPMDALLDKVDAGQVDGRMVTFEIRFEEERIICQAETWWDCKDTGERSHCKGPLQ